MQGKTLRKQKCFVEVEHVKAERNLLADVDSNCIVKLCCSFQDDEYLYLIMGYLPALHLTSIAGVVVIQFLQCFLTFMIFYLYLNNFQFSLKSFASSMIFSVPKKNQRKHDRNAKLIGAYGHAAPIFSVDFCVFSLGSTLFLIQWISILYFQSILVLGDCSMMIDLL